MSMLLLLKYWYRKNYNILRMQIINLPVSHSVGLILVRINIKIEIYENEYIKIDLR